MCHSPGNSGYNIENWPEIYNFKDGCRIYPFWVLALSVFPHNSHFPVQFDQGAPKVSLQLLALSRCCKFYFRYTGNIRHFFHGIFPGVCGISLLEEKGSSLLTSKCFPGGSVMKNLPGSAGNTGVRSLGQEDSLEEEMATHSIILSWRIPRTASLAGYKSMESQSVGRLSKHTHTHFIQLFSPGNTSLLINNIMLYTFCNLRGFSCKNHRNLWHFDGMSLVGKGEFVWIMNPPSRSSTHGPEGHITDLIVQTSH